MNANFNAGVYVEVDDSMLLPEKVMEFAKGQGWQGEIVTLADALNSKERNMADYIMNFRDAESYMNDNYASPSTMGEEAKMTWKANAEQYKWGLCDMSDDNSPFNEKTEIQVGGLTINDKKSEEPPIQQTNEPF